MSIEKIMLEMREKQKEVFENILALRGKPYTQCLAEAANALSAATFAFTEFRSGEKELHYINMAILQHALAQYSIAASVPITQPLVEGFLADLQVCTKLMLQRVKVSDLKE